MIALLDHGNNNHNFGYLWKLSGIGKVIAAFLYSSQPWLMRGFALIAGLGLVLGFAGHYTENLQQFELVSGKPSNPISITKLTLDSQTQTLQLFVLGHDPKPGLDNWVLTIAHPIAAIVPFGAI